MPQQAKIAFQSEYCQYTQKQPNISIIVSVEQVLPIDLLIAV